jgi:hypothetical protein
LLGAIVENQYLVHAKPKARVSAAFIVGELDLDRVRLEKLNDGAHLAAA